MFAQSLTILLLALVANQSAALARWLRLPLASMPVSVRWLGENKTIAPYYLAPFLVWSATVLLSGGYMGAIFTSLAIGWGAILGDHLKSFIKRRLGYVPGAPWLPDRFDFALGASLAAWFVVPWMSWRHILIVTLLAIPIHWSGNSVSYRLGWRKTPH